MREPDISQGDGILQAAIAIWTAVAACDAPLNAAERKRIHELVASRLAGDDLSAMDIQLDQLINTCVAQKQSMDSLLCSTADLSDVRNLLLEGCWAVAVADFSVSEEETALIDRVAEALGYSDSGSLLLKLMFVRVPVTDADAQEMVAYQVLGLPFGATFGQAKRSFRELCLKYHPDRHHNANPVLRELAEAKMKEIMAAYDQIRSAACDLVSLRVRGDGGVLECPTPCSIVRCLFCSQRLRLPRDAEHIRDARCPKCFRLVAFSERVASLFIPLVAEYVASEDSEVYHYVGCAVAARISDDKRVYYMSPPAGKRIHRGCPV